MRWSLLTTLLVLAACGSGVSSSGGGSGAGLPPIVAEARALLKPYYPQAAVTPTVMSSDHPTWFAWAASGVIYLQDAKWIEVAQKDLKRASCILVHEWGHHIGYDQAQATALERECLSKV